MYAPTCFESSTTYASVEVEEIVALAQYKNIKIRVCLDGECESDEEIDELAVKAAGAVKRQVKRTIKSLDGGCLAGGLSKQWAYKNGRKKREN